MPSAEQAAKGENMDTKEYRIERDSMGEVRVSKSAYYGAQIQRAVENFPISGVVFPPIFIHVLGLVKYAAAVANELWAC